MSEFLNRAQVAARYKVTPQKFAELRRGEFKEKGFPAPAFGTRQGERWLSDALDAWDLSLIPEHLRAITAPAADSETAIAAELDRRAGNLARKEKVH